MFTQLRQIRNAPAARRAGRAKPLLIVLLAAVALLLSACSPQQLDSFQRVNADRVANGVGAMSIQDGLMAKAQQWADYLASTSHLEHSTLTDSVAPGWAMLGENVGYGPSIETVEAAFMASPAHRSNILNPEFNWAGTGFAVSGNGTVFVVQVFAKY